jgi:hypothetical protein
LGDENHCGQNRSCAWLKRSDSEKKKSGGRNDDGEEVPTPGSQRKVDNRPQQNSQTFAETPSATIAAALATENPARVRKNGSVMEAKPVLIP